MDEDRQQALHDKFLAALNVPRKSGQSIEDYYDQANRALDGIELVLEVRRLNERLEAVCGVVSDADAFDGVVEANKIMEAVRGPESKVDWND